MELSQKLTDKPRLIISVDVETLGSVAGINPIISLGAAAFTMDEELVSQFETNLTTPADLKLDENTVRWWSHSSRGEAFLLSTDDPTDPAIAMPLFQKWVDHLAERYSLEFMAGPAVFDLGFLQYYSLRFNNEMVLTPKVRSWDLNTLRAIITGKPVTKANESDLPAEILEGLDNETEHVALDDAIYQGHIGVRSLNYLDQQANELIWSRRTTDCKGHPKEPVGVSCLT